MQCAVGNCYKKSIEGERYCFNHLSCHKRKLIRDINNSINIKSNRGERNGNWNGGTSEYPNHYLMKKNRLIILLYNPKCEICGNLAVEIHHRNGDKSDHRLENLMPSCHKCNIRLSARFCKKYNLTIAEILRKTRFGYKKAERLDRNENLAKYIFPLTK